MAPSGGELIVIMLVLIMLFGAKDAPKMLRNIQSVLDKMQRAAADFRYKIMYGDLHQTTYDPPESDPYDLENDEPSDEPGDDAVEAEKTEEHEDEPDAGDE